MDLSLQKRLASEILGVGKDRVYIDYTKIKEVAKALTRQDILVLIEQGIIRKKDVEGQSRYWVNYRRKQKKKGRRRGYGSRKGSKNARFDKKRRWILTIRAIRRLLRKLKEEGKISSSTYRELYLKAKGGRFRSKRALLLYLEEAGILKESQKEK